MTVQDTPVSTVVVCDQFKMTVQDTPVSTVVVCDLGRKLKRGERIISDIGITLEWS